MIHGMKILILVLFPVDAFEIVQLLIRHGIVWASAEGVTKPSPKISRPSVSTLILSSIALRN